MNISADYVIAFCRPVNEVSDRPVIDEKASSNRLMVAKSRSETMEKAVQWAFRRTEDIRLMHFV